MASFLSSPPLKSLTLELFTQLKGRSEKFLFEIINTNWKCKFCRTANELTESEVIAPGFPAFITVSSVTSGKEPEFFANYRGTTWRAGGPQIQSVYTYHLSYREVLNVFRGDQGIVHKIVVTPASGGLLRTQMGWTPSKTKTECRIRFNLVDAIDKGTIPDFEHIEYVRDHLEHLPANPVRATELRAVGPPSNIIGIMLIRNYQVKHILDPDVILQTPRYGSSECVIGPPYQPGDLNRFRVLLDDAFIKYLDVDTEEVSNNLCAAWEAEPGRLYELVLTTCNGLWRYRLGDVAELLGFAPDDGSPVVRFVERRNAVIKFDTTFLTEAQLVQSISSATQDTIGVNKNIKRAYDTGAFGMPTIRIVKPGTFTQYRKWKGEAVVIGTCQVKVPVVKSDTTAQEWIMNRVELEIQMSPT
ncbi:GH3 auxin-responsive promoter-domain-containing protein [Suillus paluster]|uniref:GH3 auxin-responsive promoter-domain-containing protein n=1 Tax=Suillus paluster TaxID=48578 RepID=UPI001B88217E|nr:GH3 auxin-responsive promoter-domain-containing protein [Suillus paluster]KAG1743315.1 GH3 auxin-responsive promoter-domain-containing protein [Suillus paluster]